MKKICLALGGGGSKGIAHIGVIKALNEAGYEISQIAGTSAGALIGGIYAATGSYQELEKILAEINYLELVNILIDWPGKDGLVRGEKMGKFLENICGQKMIENLPIKFKAVCTDVVSGQKYVFDKGKLITAIRASCAVPAIFSPIKHEGKILIDGGAVDPVPVSEIKKGKNEGLVAVNLYSKVFPKNYQKIAKASLPEIAYASMQVMVKQLTEKNLTTTAVIIAPEVDDVNVLNFVKTKNYVEIGYQATKKKMGEISKLFD